MEQVSAALVALRYYFLCAFAPEACRGALDRPPLRS